MHRCDNTQPYICKRPRRGKCGKEYYWPHGTACAESSHCAVTDRPSSSCVCELLRNGPLQMGAAVCRLLSVAILL